MSASRGRRRSFGLGGQRKIAVPGSEGNGGALLGSPTRKMAEPSKKKKVKRRSVGERVMDMFHLKKRVEVEQKATLPAVPPSPQQALRNNLQSLPTSSGSSPRPSPRFTPTPSPLRSRALGHQVFTAERQNSLEAVMHEYGYKKDGTPMLGRKKMQPEDKMVRLKIKSNGKDQDDPITLIKDDEGTGIHLSTGLPPFTVTYVEPGSKGMLAGIRVGDVIMEVNGKDCSLMNDNLELTDVMELKSIITHVPGSRPGSRPGSAISGRKYINGGHIRITSIDSDTDSSDEGDDEEDHHWNGNGQRRKKKITKGVWNRIKAEGLQDSDSESSGSFVNLVMESSSDEDDFIDKWNEQVLSKEKEIEMDDRQWKQIRQKQNLIFNRDAPSYMISNPQNNSLSHQHQLLPSTNPLTDEPLASKKKRHFKWPFTRPVTTSKPQPHKQVKKTRNAANSPRTRSPLESVLMADLSVAKILKSTDDNASNTGDSDNSSLYERPLILEKATVEGKPKKSSHSKDSVLKRPSRSQSLIEKGRKPQIRTKRVSKEAPPDIGVERTTPLLGVNDGRNKRDLARARKVRKPTTKGKTGGEREGGATLLTGQSGDEVVLQEQSTSLNSTDHHIISKTVSDPGNTSAHSSQQNTERTQKSIRRRSTANLVEEAVRRRGLAQKEEEEEEEEEKEASASRRRKHAVPAYAIDTKLTAQVVATAAAMKAKEIKQKKEHKVKETKEEQIPLAAQRKPDKLAVMSGFHPLHKSRSFQDEREKGSGKTQEATWISLAKAKHERMTGELNQKSGSPHHSDRKARLSINRSVSLNDEMDTVRDEGSPFVTNIR